ncbi:interferon-induced transmembrane protein 3-like [Amphiura filiformis]|uniref:interferon-induced transmembrane protein 3-like n=1 Tax=Amphiura filiformis TaxID=82378 RepID=UPI003B20D9F7
MDDKQELIKKEGSTVTALPLSKRTPPPDYRACQSETMQSTEPIAGSSPPEVMIIRHPQDPPKDYLIWAVLATIFCCPVCGIVAIVKNSEAKTMYAIGNYSGAEMAAQNAKKWSKWSLIAGLIILALVIIFYTVFLTVIVPSM